MENEGRKKKTFMTSQLDLVGKELDSHSASMRVRDNAVLDLLTMVILFIMAVYITGDHSDAVRPSG